MMLQVTSTSDYFPLTVLHSGYDSSLTKAIG